MSITPKIIKGLLALILTIGLMALPNALTAFDDCEHCDECNYSGLYEYCQELIDCQGIWCRMGGPSACDCSGS